MPTEPAWWYPAEHPDRHHDIWPWLLRPLSAVWAAAAERRFRRPPARCAMPVICVGNFTAGGTGKTPLSLYLAHRLLARDEVPVFLNRGYGGRHRGPHLVQVTDSATDVGDEALLLARVAPTVVSRDRVAGAAMICGQSSLARQPTVIVMDDGLQNPGLAKDLAIAVVDGRRGFGNGRVMPAGPLRAALSFQLGLVDAIVVNQPPSGAPGQGKVAQYLARRYAGPLLHARVEPVEGLQLAGLRVLALAGIANPERFFATLAGLGADVVERVSVPDHHPFSETDAARVLARADAAGAAIVTTEKDWVRLPTTGERGRMRERARTLPIRVRMAADAAAQLDAIVDAALSRRRQGGRGASA